MARRVYTLGEYERRLLSRLLREAGVDPRPIVDRFMRLRDEYSARLVDALACVDRETAERLAAKLLRSSNPFDKTLGAWLASRGGPASEPPPGLYV